MKKKQKKIVIPKDFRQPKKELSETCADTSDPRTVTVESSLALYSCPIIQKQQTNSTSSLTIDTLSDEFYHTGIKENEGAFFKGDECEKIVKIFTVGASLLFAHTSEIAWIEWKTRPNGVKPLQSGELLSKIRFRYPELLVQLKDEKL